MRLQNYILGSSRRKFTIKTDIYNHSSALFRKPRPKCSALSPPKMPGHLVLVSAGGVGTGELCYTVGNRLLDFFFIRTERMKCLHCSCLLRATLYFRPDRYVLTNGILCYLLDHSLTYIMASKLIWDLSFLQCFSSSVL